MIEISKEFMISTAHRVRTQKFTPAKCKYIHGHNYKIKLSLTGQIDNETYMVLDYNYFVFFKRFLDTCFDHRFIVDVEDPLLKEIEDKVDEILVYSPIYPQGISQDKIDDSKIPFVAFMFKSDVSIIANSITAIPIIPTAESLAYYFAHYTAYYMILHMPQDVISRIHLIGIDVSETDKTNASYVLDFNEFKKTINDLDKVISEVSTNNKANSNISTVKVTKDNTVDIEKAISDLFSSYQLPDDVKREYINQAMFYIKDLLLHAFDNYIQK